MKKKTERIILIIIAIIIVVMVFAHDYINDQVAWWILK